MPRMKEQLPQSILEVIRSISLPPSFSVLQGTSVQMEHLDISRYLGINPDMVSWYQIQF